MDPKAGNPFTEGGNPYMQKAPAQTPTPGGEMDAGMAPVGGDAPGGGDPMGGGGTSETTKPRQMPAGAPPAPPAGMPGMPPVGAPGAGAPGPAPSPQGLGVGQSSNVPQDSPKAMAARKVRAVRRDILASNPEVDVDYAHHMAMSVVAFQHFVAAAPVPQYGAQIQQQPQQGVPQYSDQRPQQKTDPNRYGGGYFGDLNDPQNVHSPLHPNHPMHHQYSRPAESASGDFVSQFGGRNPLEDHAYSKGYRGNNPHMYAAGDMALNKVVDWFRDRKSAPGQGGGQGPKHQRPLLQSGPQPTGPQTPRPPQGAHGRPPGGKHAQPPARRPAQGPAQTVLPGSPPPRVLPSSAPPAAPAAPQAAPQRGNPAPPAVPMRQVQDPVGHAKEQARVKRNEQAKKSRQRTTNGDGDLGSAQRRTKTPKGGVDTFGLTGSLREQAFPTITLDA